MEVKDKSKRNSKVKKIFGYVGLSLLTAGTAIAIIDHKEDISTYAVKVAGWVKAKTSDIVSAIKNKK